MGPWPLSEVVPELRGRNKSRAMQSYPVAVHLFARAGTSNVSIVRLVVTVFGL